MGFGDEKSSGERPAEQWSGRGAGPLPDQSDEPTTFVQLGSGPEPPALRTGQPESTFSATIGMKHGKMFRPKPTGIDPGSFHAQSLGFLR